MESTAEFTTVNCCGSCKPAEKKGDHHKLYGT